MKCDDDTFVNVPNLIHLLLGGTVPVYAATLNKHNVQTVQTLLPENRLKQFDNLLIGSRFCLAKPAKNSNSKWYDCVVKTLLKIDLIFLRTFILKVHTKLYVQRILSKVFVWIRVRFKHGYSKKVI